MVVVFQENHSFDNVLGAFCAQAAKGRPAHDPCDGATTGVLPDGSVIDLGPASDVVPPVDHRVKSQKVAIDNGTMDGFGLITGCRQKRNYACYTQFDPSQIPNVAALAGEFALSDATFEFSTTPSWVGHIVLASPVTHIWFVRGTPSRIGLLLDITPRTLEQVLYFAKYIVTEVNEQSRQRLITQIQQEVESKYAQDDAARGQGVRSLQPRCEQRLTPRMVNVQPVHGEPPVLWRDGLIGLRPCQHSTSRPGELQSMLRAEQAGNEEATCRRSSADEEC